MTNNSKSQLDDRSRVAPAKASDDLSTLSGRLAAHVHFQLMDHAFLRALWTNLDEIAPGVWRSNQPSPRRIRRYRDMGISTIISLRGGVGKSHHMFEERACAETGITLITVALSARKLLDRTRYLELFDLFDSVEKPFLMHCKSGADRAGLASALYLLHVENKSVAEARKMLSLRYMHLKNDSTGVLDFLLDQYEADIATDPMPIRQWFETRYAPKALTAAFAESRKRGRNG